MRSEYFPYKFASVSRSSEVNCDAQSDLIVFWSSRVPPSSRAKRTVPDFNQLGSGGCSYAGIAAEVVVCALAEVLSDIASPRRINAKWAKRGWRRGQPINMSGRM